MAAQLTHAGRMRLSNYVNIFTHRRPELTSWEKASDWFMKPSRIVWPDVKLLEETLRI